MLKKFNWATRQTLTPIVQRGTEAVDSPLAAEMSKSPPKCPEATYSTGSAHSGKHDVEGLPFAEKNPVQVPMYSREGSIVALGPKTCICFVAYWT